VFFTSGGGQAVESAGKVAVQYVAALGQPARRPVISRDHAYHGTTSGALSITRIPAIRDPFEPLLPWAVKVPNTNRDRCLNRAESPARTLACADEVERTIRREGPETVAMIVMEPVQNTGDALVPPEGYWARRRRIADRYGILLVSDEECHWIFRDQLSPRIFSKGLICRADDRAEPVLVLSPTLVCGPQERRFIGKVLTEAITETAAAFANR